MAEEKALAPVLPVLSGGGVCPNCKLRIIAGHVDACPNCGLLVVANRDQLVARRDRLATWGPGWAGLVEFLNPESKESPFWPFVGLMGWLGLIIGAIYGWWSAAGLLSALLAALKFGVLGLFLGCASSCSIGFLGIPFFSLVVITPMRLRARHISKLLERFHSKSLINVEMSIKSLIPTFKKNLTQNLAIRERLIAGIAVRANDPGAQRRLSGRVSKLEAATAAIRARLSELKAAEAEARYVRWRLQINALGENITHVDARGRFGELEDLSHDAEQEQRRITEIDDCPRKTCLVEKWRQAEAEIATASRGLLRAEEMQLLRLVDNITEANTMSPSSEAASISDALADCEVRLDDLDQLVAHCEEERDQLQIDAAAMEEVEQLVLATSTAQGTSVED